jgi:hypothetical protein
VAAAKIRVARDLRTQSLKFHSPPPGYHSTLFCLQLISIERNTIFISNYNVSKIFTRMGPHFPIQLTVLFDINISQEPVKLFQISQRKSSTEISTRNVISFTIPRSNNSNLTQSLLCIPNGENVGEETCGMTLEYYMTFNNSELWEMWFEIKIKQRCDKTFLWPRSVRQQTQNSGWEFSH